MSVIEQLLKYQQEDSKLLAIEREVANSDERKKLVQAKNFVDKATERLDGLEAKATELFALINTLNKKCDGINEDLAEFTHIDEMISDGADISFYKKNILQLTEQIRALREEINNLVKTAKKADEEYRALKEKTISVQSQQAELSENYKKLKKSKMEETLAIQKELDKLKEGLPSETIKRYEIKRSERIFPIICEVKGGRCSKCGTELSISAKDALDSGKPVECENCHRFLYKED